MPSRLINSALIESNSARKRFPFAGGKQNAVCEEAWWKIPHVRQRISIGDSSAEIIKKATRLFGYCERIAGLNGVEVHRVHGEQWDSAAHKLPNVGMLFGSIRSLECF